MGIAVSEKFTVSVDFSKSALWCVIEVFTTLEFPCNGFYIRMQTSD